MNNAAIIDLAVLAQRCLANARYSDEFHYSMRRPEIARAITSC